MNLLATAQALLPETIALRRKLHQYPELAFQEFETAALVSATLRELGYEVREGVGKTGVVGYQTTEKPGPTFLLRFDMDALPVQEETDAAYISKKPGLMHACGHDAHVATGLTVAKMITQLKKELAGNFMLVFQPAEEMGSGALAMIEDGVLADPKPDYAMGLHVWSPMPTGTVGITSGPVMANAYSFAITVKGQGGHGAMPQEARDPVIASAQIILALQTIVSRILSPLESGVISVTVVQGGTAGNIIPDKVEMKGTMRAFSPDVAARMQAAVKRICDDVARANQCEAEFKIHNDAIAVVNDRKVVEAAQKAFRVLSPEGELVDNYQVLASEDMSYFLNAVPGVFVFLGAGQPDGRANKPHHHPSFDIDESALPLGAALLLQTTQILAAKAPHS